MATRRERVVLELEDQFTTPMLRAAAAAELMKRNLGSLSGQSVQSSKTTRDLENETKKLGNTAGGSAREVDRMSGRLRILADVALIATPALSAVGAVGVAGIAGLSSEIGFAVVGVGAAVLAFHGLGDALKAVNKAAISPTETNLKAAKLAMDQLSPAARTFVNELQALTPELKRLQAVAQANMFPGLAAGLKDLETTLPAVEHIIASFSGELGHIGEQAGKSLSSGQWAPFLDFLATEGPAALGGLARSIGNVTHGLAELWMAFTPLNRDFGSWLVDSSKQFDKWASGLDQTQGFQDFIAYVHQNGPLLAQTIGDVAQAFLAIGKAAAPLAGPVLGSLDAIARIVTTIADSDLGTPIYAAVTAMMLFNRATQMSTSLQAKWGTGLSSMVGKIGLLAAGIAAFSVADSALHLSLTQGDIGRMSSVLDAKAGPNLIDQIKATQDAIKSYQQTADNANIHINLGFTDIYSSDKAAKAADAVIGLKGHLKDLQNQQVVNDAAAKATANSTDLYSSSMIQSANAAGLDASKLAALTETKDNHRKATLQAFDAETQYRQALKDAAAQAATNKAGIKGSSDAALKNRGALSQLAAAWNNQSDAVKNNIDRSAQNRKAFIQTATAMGVPIRKARELARTMLDLPASKVIAVHANTDPAFAAFIALKHLMDSFHDLNLHVNVTKNTNANVAEGVANNGHPKQRPADGATVLGDRYPYADKTLLLAAPGEEVISNRYGQADRNRSLLKAINANRFADGGTVGGHSGLAAYIRNDLDMKFPHTLAQWNKALKESTKVVDAEKTKRQALLDQAQAVKDSIGTNYKSDLFGKSNSSVWMSSADRAKAGKGDVFSTLTGDIGNLTALKAAIAQLKAKGLNGGALAELLSNGSLQDVQSFAGGSKSDVAKYESLYNRRDSLAAQVGAAGAAATNGAQLAALNRQLAVATRMTAVMTRVETLLKHNPHATGVEVGRAIKGVAPHRPKKGG